jgi:tol-pal system protein YbgF
MNLLARRIGQLERQNADLSTKLSSTQEEAKKLGTDLDAYRKSNSQSQQEVRGNTATLSATVDQLRKDLQVVTGKLEEADYSIEKSRSSQVNTAQEKENRLNRIEEVGRLNRERIVRLEQYLDLEPSTDEEKPSDKAGKKISDKKALPEKDLYEAAKKAFDKGEFEVAREQFLEFLKRFPKSNNADNAQFWIGEIYFREKWYEKAIMEYQKVIESYPNGNKVAAALLKQGLAFFNLDEKANARLILKEMIRKYPKSEEAKIAKKKLSSFH